MKVLEQTETNLSDEAILAIVDFFDSYPDKATTYLNLWRDTLRKRYIRAQLRKMGVPFEE